MTHSCETKQNSTNMKKVQLFAQMPSSKSTEKKAEATLVSLPKRIKKEKKVKKEGEGKTEEKKNKEGDHSIRKLEGSGTYRCKFDKEWPKKNPCIESVKEDPMRFFVQFAQRKLVVLIELLVMLSDTVKQFFILSLKMK